MKKLILLLLFVPLVSLGQTTSTEQIKEFAEKMNEELPYTMPGTNVTLQNISAMGRTIIYTYQVPEGWIPFEDIKTQLLNTLSLDLKKLYSNEQINLMYNYFRDGGLVKGVRISYRDFNLPKLNSLGDYISYKSHPKAKGVNIKIKDPLGFEKLEGDRPNIVAKYNNKDENLVYTVLIIELPLFFSRNEIKEYVFNENSDLLANEFVKEFRGELISSRYTEIDNYSAIEFVFDLEKDILNQKISMRSVAWYIYYEDRIIALNGGTTKANFEKYKYIFSLITNSILFEEQYNYPGSEKIFNTTNFDDFVDKFYRELEGFGINKIRPNKINIRLEPLDSFKNTSHYHGFSLGSNNDNIIDIVLNERSWNNFTKAQKYYLIFHELCHDVLNLKDLNYLSNEKEIMYPSIHNFKNLTMDDFIENFHKLLEKY